MTLGSKGEHEYAIILFDPGIGSEFLFRLEYPSVCTSTILSMGCHHLPSLIFNHLLFMQFEPKTAGRG